MSSIGHVDVTPFTAAHLDATAALLAARHLGDRTREPELPARFEAPGATRALLERIFQRPGATGVVAMRRGRVVGYLIGYLIFTPPTSYGAAFIATRAGFIGYAGHAVDVADAIDVLGALYGALAADWVDAGCLSHYVVVPTDARAEERWHTLGFGRGVVTAMRATDALGPADWPGEIRRGRPEDLDTVVGFMNGLHRFEEAAPMWRPYVPESEAEARDIENVRRPAASRRGKPTTRGHRSAAQSDDASGNSGRSPKTSVGAVVVGPDAEWRRQAKRQRREHPDGRESSDHPGAPQIGSMFRQHPRRVEPASRADAGNGRRHSKACWPRRSPARWADKCHCQR